MKKLLIFCLTILILFTAISPVDTLAAEAEPKAGKVKITSGTLNVRETASTKGRVLSYLKKDSFVTLIKKSGNWWQVEYADNKLGYCHENYITSLNSTTAKVKLTSGRLNVRSGASTGHKIVGSLANGKKIIVLSEKNGWSRILYSGTKTGYVSAKYLQGVGAEVQKITLNVPSYKQTDSRWANYKIGSSGKTMAEIGCATTGIAMMESFRQGKTIYPDAMAKSLKYTSGGNVYWPQNFVVETSSNNYLGEILNILKKGKPVLLGCKNAYGSQHWVVITGFEGSEVTAANFKINDPGSNTRLNLSQFLSKYPNFYKFFCYS